MVLGEMYELLKSPPLVEAVCEFRFSPSGDWDWTIPGRLYDRLKGRYPKKGAISTPGVTINIGEPPRVRNDPGRIFERGRMLNEDESAMVQIGVNVVSVHSLSDYPGWSEFSGMILEAAEAYKEIAPDPIERIGLRYINRIPHDVVTSNDISDVLVLDPPIPESVDRPVGRFHQRYELIHEDLNSVLTLQCGANPSRSDPPHFYLDLDFFTRQISAFDMGIIKTWLEESHARLEQAFVASLNEDLYARMKEGYDVDRASE